MQQTNSFELLVDQAVAAELATNRCSAGEQHALTLADSGRSKQKPSVGGGGSPQPRALRVNDAAAIYGLSRSTLYKLMAPGGGLRSVKVGGRRLVPVDAMEALISGNDAAASGVFPSRRDRAERG
jgi:excisionase family DNA binding protein